MKRKIFDIKALLGCLLVIAIGGIMLSAQVSMAQPVGADASPPKFVEQVTNQSTENVRVTEKAGSKEVVVKSSLKNKKRRFSIDKMSSLFFTYWQHQSIIDAKNSHGRVRPPTKAELAALESGEDFKPDPGRRDISLGGIVYNNEDDWTIWLNGLRVQPDAIPKEVLSLEVFKDYIEVKWHDKYTNKIYPLRLRSHQRFNMDMRIFLPG